MMSSLFLPGTFISAKDVAVNKADKNSSTHAAYIAVRGEKEFIR